VAKPRAGTLGGSNKMLSAREIAAILPERMVARNGGTGDCPSTGPVSTCGGKNAKSLPGSTAKQHDT
jgi:hypothetical protein